MSLASLRRGSGKPLVLVHGLGSTRAAWSLVTLALADQRTVVAVDLPGHGASPAEADSGSFAGQVRSFEQWLDSEGLAGADLVGSSMGARLVLEMARRGHAGGVVALDPGGFWEGWERGYIHTSLGASVAALRLLQPALPILAQIAAARTALLPQLSARPWALSGELVERELLSFARSPVFDELLQDLAYGPLQEGPAGPGAGPVTIGWGRHDRVTLPIQAERARTAFPGCRFHWFEASGHFPMWDEPDAVAAFMLKATGSR